LIDFKKFFAYLVSQIGNLVKIESMASYLGLKYKKIQKYLDILSKTLFLQLCYPFYTNKAKEYSSHPKIYFHDVGILNLLKKNFDYIDF
jgi:predicted AAA+ superfamily ATPase